MSSPGRPPRGLRLEKVLGMTADCNAALDINPKNDDIAYPAGCIVVIYSHKKNKQRAYMRTSKPVWCLKYAPDGDVLAIGEFCGSKPSVTLWDIFNHKRLSELKGHTHGVQCISFSPTERNLVVTVGFSADSQIILWDWEKGVALAKTTFTGSIYACDFSHDGKQICTVGSGEYNLRYWEINYEPDSEGGYSLEEYTGGLTPEYRNAEFQDVSCGRNETAGLTFAVTSCGALVCFGPNRMMQKWVLLETTSSFSVDVRGKYIVCGCSKGIVRLFDPLTLEFVATLPRPPRQSECSIDPAASNLCNENEEGQGILEYPSATGVKLSSEKGYVVSMYSDRSLFVWNASQPDNIIKSRSFLNHKSALWGLSALKAYRASTKKTDNEKSEKYKTPEGLLVTCGDDQSIRFWKLGNKKKENDISANKKWISNPYSKELVRVINVAIDDDHSSRKIRRIGLRCVAVSADAMHVAVGDKDGFVRIFDVNSKNLIYSGTEHKGDVVGIEFAPSNLNNSNVRFLASAGGDGKVQLYLDFPSKDKDASIHDIYELVQTLSDHQKEITAIRFSSDAKKFISCGAESNVNIYQVNFEKCLKSPKEDILTKVKTISIPYGTIHDLDVDVTNKFMATAGQDKNIYIWSMATGKVIREYMFDQDQNKAGEKESLHSLHLDPAGMYLTACSTDRTIRLFDFYSGECVGKGSGHSESITGLAFSSDCKRLISVSCDGCMFVWRLASEITTTIRDRLDELRSKEEEYAEEKTLNENLHYYDKEIPETQLKFSSTKLPTWARDPNKLERNSKGGDNMEELDSVVITSENDDTDDASERDQKQKQKDSVEAIQSKLDDIVKNYDEEKDEDYIETDEEEEEEDFVQVEVSKEALVSPPTGNNDATENEENITEKSTCNIMVTDHIPNDAQEQPVNDPSLNHVDEQPDDRTESINSTGILVELPPEITIHDDETRPPEESSVIGSPLLLSPVTPPATPLPSTKSIAVPSIELSKSSVSTSPRSPLPNIEVSRSLSRERDALKLRAHRKDTDIAVERMRKKLKEIGILASTKKLAKINETIPNEDDIITASSCDEEKVQCSQKQTKCNQRNDEKVCTTLQETENIVTQSDKVVASPVAKFESGEKENINENKQKRPTTTIIHGLENLEIDTTSINAVDPPLKSVKDARQACEDSLQNLQNAISNTVSTLVSINDLEESFTNANGERNVDMDNAEGLIEIRNLLGNFKTRLGRVMESDIESAASVMSARKKMPQSSMPSKGTNIMSNPANSLSLNTPSGLSYFESSSSNQTPNMNQNNLQMKMLEQILSGINVIAQNIQKN